MVCTYEWCVYAGRFYVKCMFALILHIICPITLTAAINLLQSYFRQKHKGLTLCAVVWTAMKYEKQRKNRKQTAPFLLQKLNCGFGIKNSARVERRRPTHDVKLLLFKLDI